MSIADQNGLPAHPHPRRWTRLFERRAGGQRPRAASPCCIVGVLVLIDRNLPIDGLVTEISVTAVQFRPASVYIFDRQGAEVAVRFGDQDIRGRIGEVSALGYRIRLAAPLEEAVVSEVIEQFGMVG